MLDTRSRLLGVATAALLLAACGGDDDEKDTPARTVESFYAAAAERDAQAACKETTKKAEPQLQFLLHNLFIANQPCDEAVKDGREGYEIGSQPLADVEVEVTEESDDEATAKATWEEESLVQVTIFLIREGDDWKINEQLVGRGNP